MAKIMVNIVRGREGNSLQITDNKGNGFRVAGPKAWGNPYNKPFASFEVDAEELIECIKDNQY
jgi:hypothetical protein